MVDSGSAMAELKAEFVHGLPLETAWKMAKRSDMILPSVLPHVFAKVERLEGDGGVGTIRIVTLGDGNNQISLTPSLSLSSIDFNLEDLPLHSSHFFLKMNVDVNNR